MANYGLMADYRHGIAELIQQKREFLGDGKAKNHEEYKDITGQIRGLKAAAALFDEIVNRYMREEGELNDQD